jgi:hypothetical protein
MKNKRPAKPSRASSFSYVRYSKDRRIVLLDQQPLREEAGGEAKRILREVHEHSEKIAEFDRTILPAYERWESENLAGLLNEERQLVNKVSEMQRLIEFADFESVFTGRDPYEIYEEAVREFAGDTPRENSAPPPEEEPPEPDPDEGYEPEERDFRSYVRFVFGDDPDSIGPRKYQRLFEDYRRWREKMGAARSPRRAEPDDVPARVKEIYRILVRRLHPDTGRDRSNPQTRKLWDELQQAYSSHDLERLEVLLAITDLHESGSAARSTLFHIRQVARQLRQQLDSLKVRLRQIKKTPAWTFWHSKDRKSAGKKIRQAVEKRVQSSKTELTRLERELARWKEEFLSKKARRRTAGGVQVRGRKTRKKTSSSDVQGVFDI